MPGGALAGRARERVSGIRARLLLRMALIAVNGLALLMVVACASTPLSADKRPRDPLAGICQFKPCVCAASSGSIFSPDRTSPVQFGERGDAMCPAGFTLRQTEPRRAGIPEYN